MASHSPREAKECCQAPKGAGGLGPIVCVSFPENRRLLILSLKSSQGRVGAGKRIVRGSLRQCDLDFSVMCKEEGSLWVARPSAGSSYRLTDTEGCYESRLGHKLKSG